VQESDTNGYYLQDFTASGRELRAFGRDGVLAVPASAEGAVLPVNLMVGARGDVVAVVPTRRGITMSERSG
jgi:hypothetical protein